MAPASKALRRFQIGPESTPGTAVPATFKMVGNTTYTIERDAEMEDFPRQVYAPVTGGGIDLRKGTLINFEGNLTYEEALHIFASVIETPATAGAGPYTHTFDRPWNGPPTLTSYTCEITEDDGSTKHIQKEAAYLTGMGFEVVIAGLAPAKVTWEAIARASADTTETADLDPLTGRTAIASNLFKFYLDDTAGGIGGTLLSDVVRAATLKYAGAVAPAYNLDGRTALDFTGIRHKPFTPDNAPTLSITMELAATAAAEFADYLAGNKRYVRLTATNGTDSITFDLCAVHVSAPVPEEDDGVMVVTFEMRMEYDATLTFKAVVVNGLADVDAT